MVVLVASIPLAVEIVTTTTMAMGSRILSKKVPHQERPVDAHAQLTAARSLQGAIVTRLASIESMAGMDMLCSDKTGTLTLNKMVIQVPDDCLRNPFCA